MKYPVSLSSQQAHQIAQLVGLKTRVGVTEIQQQNHVWQLDDGQDVYFLKTFTKVWYGDDVPGTAFCVRHEQDAYACLSAHGLSIPEIVWVSLDCDNPLGRPFMVTKKLKGESLMALLDATNAPQFHTLLEKAGEYMGRMHSISFDFPGYIVNDGPTVPPDENGWQHPAWSVRKTQQEAFASLDMDRPHITVELAEQLQSLFLTIPEVLSPAFQPPHFTQVNCHSHQFFLWQDTSAWQVSGCLDMEVASAGCCLYDLAGFCIQMAAFFPATSWWLPFFQGYGREPDFDLFKLLLLGLPEICFRIYGETRWPGTRQHILTHLLMASDWDELFAESS